MAMSSRMPRSWSILNMNMNKKLISLLSFTILATAGCSRQVSTSEAVTAVCQDLSTLKQELATLANLTPQSTVGELRAARDRIEVSLDKLKRAENVLEKARLDELKKAEKNFEEKVNGISKKDTLAEATAQVKQAGAQVEAARAQLSSTVQCP